MSEQESKKEGVWGELEDFWHEGPIGSKLFYKETLNLACLIEFQKTNNEKIGEYVIHILNPNGDKFTFLTRKSTLSEIKQEAIGIWKNIRIHTLENELKKATEITPEELLARAAALKEAEILEKRRRIIHDIDITCGGERLSDSELSNLIPIIVNAWESKLHALREYALKDIKLAEKENV